MRQYLAMIVGIATLCSTVRAEPPATAPAVVPSTQPAQSPKEMLKGYNAAMRAGDADTIAKLHHASGDAQERVAAAMAKAEVQVGALLVAAREKFGADGLAKVGKAIGDLSDSDIDSSEVTIMGDRAVMRFPSGGAQEFVLASGQWKIPVSALMRGSPSAEPVIDSISRRGNFAKVLTQDINSGQVKTLEDVLQRIDRRNKGLPDGPDN
jgi:hypothetical protein